MEYIYAALLLHKLDKEVTEDAIKSVVEATGTDVDESKVKSLVASLKDIDIASELAKASLVSAAPAGASASAEHKKEEKPKEEKKAAAAEGLSSLFG